MTPEHQSTEFWKSPRVATVLAVGFALLILAVSSIPAHQMPRSPELWRWDKAVHALEYAVFAALVFRAFTLRGYRVATAAFASAILCTLFGGLDESYQSTVPGRDSSVLDVMADGAGACFACFASAVLYSRARSPHVHNSNLR